MEMMPQQREWDPRRGAELFSLVAESNSPWSESRHRLFGPRARAGIITSLLVNNRQGYLPNSIWTGHILPFLSNASFGNYDYGGSFRNPGRGHGGGMPMPQAMVTWIVRSYYWCDTPAEWEEMSVHIGQRLINTRVALLAHDDDTSTTTLESWKESVPWRPPGRRQPAGKLRTSKDEDVYGIPGFFEDIASVDEADRADGWGNGGGTYWLGWFIADRLLSVADRKLQRKLKLEAPPWPQIPDPYDTFGAYPGGDEYMYGQDPYDIDAFHDAHYEDGAHWD